MILIGVACWMCKEIKISCFIWFQMMLLWYPHPPKSLVHQRHLHLQYRLLTTPHHLPAQNLTSLCPLKRQTSCGPDLDLSHFELRTFQLLRKMAQKRRRRSRRKVVLTWENLFTNQLVSHPYNNNYSQIALSGVLNITCHRTIYMWTSETQWWLRKNDYCIQNWTVYCCSIFKPSSWN